MNYLIEYYNEIEDGNIIVGQELKTELDQLIQDLDNPAYIFDEKPGNLRIDFIETFCKHTKSPFNGLPFILELWEKALIQTAYGFKMADSGLRRFNEVILLIARKNGKTTFVAGIDLAEFFLSSGGVDIVCASNTTEQANILFEEINNMREQSPALSKDTRSKKNIFHIYSPKTKNKIKKLSAQSRNKDGYNIEVGCIDEVHEMTDSKVYDAIKQSQSTKKEPLIFIITTEGTTIGGFLDSKLDYARKMLKGKIQDNRVLPWLYTQDSTKEIYEDPTTWQKSNPSIGVVKLNNYLEDVMNKSKHDLSTRVTMLCKDFNIKQAVRWMPMDKWDKCAFAVNEEDLFGRVCYGGLDLSSSIDITAFVLVFPPEDEDDKYVVLPYFWLPEETLNLRVNRDHVPYDVWEKQEHLKTTEGNVVHYGFIEKFIESLGEKYNIREIAFDRWGAVQMVQNLEGMGFTVVPFGQGFKDMSPPTKELMKLTLEEKVAHGGHPVLRWMMDNIFIRTDPAGNIKPDKEKSTEKIDGAVATIMALDRAIRCGNDTSASVYDGRGLLVF
jgi:phage terminase large subunit-like protein